MNVLHQEAVDAARPLVFIGDSITDAGRFGDADGLGEGYVRMIANRLRGRRGAVVNRGVSGDRAVDLLARWDADVMALRPDTLTIMVGINDVWRRFDSDDPTSADQFEATYRELIDRARAVTRRIVVMDPFLIPVDSAQEEWLGDLDGKQTAVARLAAEFGLETIRLQGSLLRAAAEHGPTVIAPDGVHPSALGHDLIAREWLGVVAADL